MYASADLSEIYKGSLTRAQRTIAIINKKYVVVQDKIESSDTAATIRWTLLTPANVKITGRNTAELTKDGRRLLLSVAITGGGGTGGSNSASTSATGASTGNLTMKTWPTDPPPNSYDAPNPGTIRVGFEVTIPARSKAAIVVSLMPSPSTKNSDQN
ncbi:MAG: hypothetical protein JF563_05995 [Acidobacteriales bacterium]|nr:hypothetical protein [Terriglobales bacterium]